MEGIEFELHGIKFNEKETEIQNEYNNQLLKWNSKLKPSKKLEITKPPIMTSSYFNNFVTYASNTKSPHSSKFISFKMPNFYKDAKKNDDKFFGGITSLPQVLSFIQGF